LGLHPILGLAIRGRICPAFVRARVRPFARREKIRPQSRRASFYSVYGRVYRAERSAAQRLDGSMRGNRRADAGHFRRAGVQFVRRTVWRAAFYRARLFWLFSKFVQLDSCRHPCRWPHRKCAVALALVAGFCIASLFRMVVSEFYLLAHCYFVTVALVFVIS